MVSKAPKATFHFNFSPLGADHGTWTYAYDLTAAGETHDASGSYTLKPTGTGGVLVLTMTGSDRVAFKGFSGAFPVHYGFNLVPSPDTPCP